MEKQEIWHFARERSVRTYRLYFGLGREILWVKQSDFQQIKHNFKREKINIFANHSYRSNNIWRHVHAVDYGEYVNMHCDTGNLIVFFPLGFFHLVFDVLPYTPHIIWYKIRYSMNLVDALPPQ